MASERGTLQAENGVTLTEVALRSGSAVVAVTYIVQSERTPEVPNFTDLTQADPPSERRSDAAKQVAQSESSIVCLIDP